MSRLNPPVGPGDHVLGDPSAPLTLVEYGEAHDDLRPTNCERGVHPIRLAACVNAIESEACSGIGSGLQRSIACKTSTLCP